MKIFTFQQIISNHVIVELVILAVAVFPSGGGGEIKKCSDEIKIEKICIQLDEDFTGNEGELLSEEIEPIVVQIRGLDSQGQMTITVIVRFPPGRTRVDSPLHVLEVIVAQLQADSP